MHQCRQPGNMHRMTADLSEPLRLILIRVGVIVEVDHDSQRVTVCSGNNLTAIFTLCQVICLAWQDF
jgi:hypothetical protein